MKEVRGEEKQTTERKALERGSMIVKRVVVHGGTIHFAMALSGLVPLPA